MFPIVGISFISEGLDEDWEDIDLGPELNLDVTNGGLDEDVQVGPFQRRLEVRDRRAAPLSAADSRLNES